MDDQPTEDADTDPISSAAIGFAVSMQVNGVVESPLPPLFHYTTAEGLKGIVESKSLLSSHTALMNDPAELNYAVNMCRMLLDREFPNMRDSSAPSVLDQLVLQTVVAGLNSMEHLLTAFVTSFCQKDDLLSQWRGYTSSTSVFSIGLDVDTFANAAMVRGDVRRVIYEPPEQEKLILSAIQIWSTLLKGLIADGKIDVDDINHVIILRTGFIMGFARIALSVKQPAFSEEREWRIITIKMHPGNAEARDRFPVRIRNGVFVPYVELKDSSPPPSGRRFPITSVRVGPSSDVVVSLIGIRNLLRVNNIDGIEPMPSAFQLR